MSQRHIKDKLRTELELLETREIPLDEAFVIYFLVEARKMIAREKSDNSFQAIVFYRDWAVHIQKDWAPPFIEEMIENSGGKLERFVEMGYLREEIARFLGVHKLSDS
ncbi:MAG: hypothetical protein M1604_00015 [Patescibacteria group bacterium]|nr:hypothetical protein [Patescibacteria group bacterium]